MPGKPFSQTISQLRRPILWIPGLFAGALAASFLWLAFTGGEFIAGKLFFLGAVLFPFFIAGALSCLKTRDDSPGQFVRSAFRYYFPVILPVIVAVAIVILLLILFSIPFAIAGLGTDPSMIGGLFIGILMPVILFTFYADNVAVSEERKVFDTLKRSMILASRSFFAILSCLVLTVLNAIFMGVILATVWGMILADQFAPYINLSVTEQQEIFSTFGVAEWQDILGTTGIAITAVMIGIYTMILVTFFIIYKQQTYLTVQEIPDPEIPVQGEYDEKGRWYKY